MTDGLWWQRGIVYQVYPRSFQDTDGDGVGDLPGITSRLPYLSELGVDAVWLSPIYPSPMRDFGYDISDHCAVHPLFGTLEDLDRLVAEAHRLGLRVLLDYVPNHTSREHPWFVESRSSRDNPRRDWYLWHDPAPDGGPPNNWLSHFGGSAWTFDPHTGQYYYHAFLPDQPDLNWRDPAVVDAMLGVLRFWLERGVGGFRVDVLWQVIKDAEFRDDPPNPDWVPEQGPYNALRHVFSSDRPEVHDIVVQMRRVLDAYGDTVMVGEIWLPLERLVTYYGNDANGTHLPLNFQLIELPWRADALLRAVDAYEDLLPRGGWPNWVLGSHDIRRTATRVGPAQARVAAMMLLTLRGTPTMYYGDEIGMHDVPIPPDKVQDPYERNVPGLGFGRDPQRSPMQWDVSHCAGFTTGEPWLPVADDFFLFNVENGSDDPASLLNLYRRLIALRREEPALSVGQYVRHGVAEDVIVYERRHDGRRFVVALNMGHEPRSLAVHGPRSCRVVLSTGLDREGDEVCGTLTIRDNEGLVLRVQ